MGLVGQHAEEPTLQVSGDVRPGHRGRDSQAAGTGQRCTAHSGGQMQHEVVAGSTGWTVSQAVTKSAPEFRMPRLAKNGLAAGCMAADA